MTLPLMSRICIWTSLFQGHLSRLLLLACIATSVAATVLGVNSIIKQTSVFYYEISSTCYSLLSGMNSGYESTWFTDDSDWKTQRCREYLNMMMVRMEPTQPSLSGTGALEGRNEQAL